MNETASQTGRLDSKVLDYHPEELQKQKLRRDANFNARTLSKTKSEQQWFGCQPSKQWFATSL